MTSVIYSLAEFLKTEFPNYFFYTNTVELIAGQDVIPNQYILIMESGGTEGHGHKFNIYTIQILTRSIDAPIARKMSYDVYEKIDNRIGLILPAIIIGAESFNEIQTSQISAIQSPYPLGKNTEGLFEFTNNYQIYFDAEVNK